jgi:hypothetical protein
VDEEENTVYQPCSQVKRRKCQCAEGLDVVEDSEETAKNVSGRTTEFIHNCIMYAGKQFSSFKILLQSPHLANSWILIIESFSFLNCSVNKHGLAYYITFPVLFHTEERFQSKDQVITNSIAS